MPSFEYKVIPAPKRAEKIKGVRSAEERFAHTLMALINELANDGWEYQRSETLPVETRSGLTSKTLVDQTVLIFRRSLEIESTAEPLVLGTPVEQQSAHHAPSLPGADSTAPANAPRVNAPKTETAD